MLINLLKVFLNSFSFDKFCSATESTYYVDNLSTDNLVYHDWVRRQVSSSKIIALDKI